MMRRLEFIFANPPSLAAPDHAAFSELNLGRAMNYRHRDRRGGPVAVRVGELSWRGVKAPRASARGLRATSRLRRAVARGRPFRAPRPDAPQPKRSPPPAIRRRRARRRSPRWR